MQFLPGILPQQAGCSTERKPALYAVHNRQIASSLLPDQEHDPPQPAWVSGHLLGSRCNPSHAACPTRPPSPLATSAASLPLVRSDALAPCSAYIPSELASVRSQYRCNPPPAHRAYL